jgi:cell division protein FtsL
MAVPSPRDVERLAQSLARSVLVQLMLAMTCLSIVALLYLAQASLASVAEYNIAELESARSQLTAQNASLHATITTLQSVQRIDIIATTQLHMAGAKPSDAIWIQPVVPAVPPIHPPEANTAAAQKQSQPVGWVARFVRFVRASL